MGSHQSGKSSSGDESTVKRSPLIRTQPAPKASIPILRKRKCKGCGESFRPFRPMQMACGLECAQKVGKATAAKNAEREHKRKLADSKKLSHWVQLTESVVHSYIHARDRGLPCISCGTRSTVQWEAGHWLTKAARPELRFDPRNINLQCHRCNKHLSGNQAAYRIGLVAKIGLDQVRELEGPHPAAKYTREGLAEIRSKFSLMKREAVDAERDQLRQRVEALTDDALARVMVASEDELNAALKLEGKDPEDTARLSGQAIQIATLTHERDQLRAEVEALRADAELLDWMQRQSLDDFAVGLVVDAQHDGDYWCSPDTGGMYYGKTLREAMKAARKG